MQANLSEKLKTYRISQPEYEKICDLLGREPKGLEWALFSALWSEHCSYKSSKIHLKKLFGKSKRVLQSFGENAGIVDLGDGEKIAFKMESHNHPSFIEPYQGAATGVGGILRDIFTMGARPIALANYLCFGEPKAQRMSTLVDGVVRGIGGYGNCVGVPTVTGQTHFDPSYNENILVNAMAVGYFGKKDPICLSKAKGVGNHVVYVGAKTGRDGIHGASMASESFDDNSAAKRPTVQIGDPFYEKLLIEACLEVMKKDLVVAIQDMGAAGLTSSTFEMAEKGGVGIEMDLSQVPLRDSTLTPEDIMLSESQERMLLICEPKNFAALKQEFDRWGLDACVVGRVTDDKKVRLLWHGEVICETEPEMIVSSAPEYERTYEEHQLKWPIKKAIPQKGEGVLGDAKMLNTILTSHHGGDRSWIYNQYDQRVGAATANDCSHAVGVVRLQESHRGLGVVLGCRPHVMRMDPYFGGIDSVVHPSLQLATYGFEPLAVTDCLNFGNPEKKETMTQFVAALQGMNTFCQRLETPIISGNVSFYNETKNKNVSPTPSTGLVGLRPSVENLPHDSFYKENQDVVLLTFGSSWFSGFLGEITQATSDGYLEKDLSGIETFVKKLTLASQEGLFASGRVVGKFGLLYALARMSLEGMGAQIVCDQAPFTEVFYQILLSTNDVSRLSKALLSENVSLTAIGKTQKASLQWNEHKWATEELKNLYKKGWEASFAQLAR
ncbi:MAG: phosphoribosylformylglycinamidine synthase subunit PurL [Bdellovibrionaceae bacterium]|nr:phosphoribosylformylglycinamidine synthase subunit PurL [Pseudobdellovibrionaceae bacterium]